jgi:hypothetical protein
MTELFGEIKPIPKKFLFFLFFVLFRDGNVRMMMAI